MNELAAEIADSMEEHAALLRVAGPHARQRRAGDRRGRGRARAATTPGLRSRRSAWADSAASRTRRCRSASEAWPGVTVWTDHPAVSCMASQYAGWAISVDKFFAMGSGPLRAHARVEKELFEKLGVRRGGRARRAGAGGTHAADRRGGRMGGQEGPAHARPAYLRHRADGQPRRRACRSRRASWRRAFTRWSRSGSTCGG